jgi:arginyl-tRNA synthetase
MARYPEAMSKAAESYDPSEVAIYAYRLSNLFNSFYHECPVIQAENEELKKARQKIVESYIQIMQNALRMLRIEPVEEM